MAKGRGVDFSWLIPVIVVVVAYQFLESWTVSIAVGLGAALFLMAVEAVKGGVGHH